jgi:curved DNA-binding protein CbpA
MRDPYDILGVPRGASLDEIKAAYRRACKARHPDMGDSHEAMTEVGHPLLCASL